MMLCDCKGYCFVRIEYLVMRGYTAGMAGHICQVGSIKYNAYVY